MYAKQWNQCFVSLIVLTTCFTLNTAKEDSVVTAIGIDLGTSYATVGVINNGKVEILVNEQGNQVTPCIIGFTREGQRLIGDSAKSQLTSNPENTIFNIKRLIGHKWNDSTLQSDINYIDFNVIEEKDKPYVKIKTSEKQNVLAPEEITAMLLTKMKKMAEDYLGKKVFQAVITVPAYFNYLQRKATIDAGTIAGFEQIGLINEPSAAALAYGQDNQGEKNILVFKLGAGSLDVSILKIVGPAFEVMATNGDTHLGGENIDQRIIDYFVQYYEELTGKDITTNRTAFQRLRLEVERVIRILSDKNEALIEIESLFEGQDFREILTRDEFEELNEDLFRLLIKSVHKVLLDAGFDVTDIDDIILVGGSTRIPKVRQLIKDYFGGKELIFGQEHLAAIGATIQAGNLFGHIVYDQSVLMEICPFDLGINVGKGNMNIVISRNTIIPVKKTKTFTNSIEDQTEIGFAIYEGNQFLSKDNLLLTYFILEGIRPAPKGEAKIVITFTLDHNGLLEIGGDNEDAGYNPKIVSKNDIGLKPEDIEQMITNAENMAEDDKKFEKKFRTRNEFKSYVYSLKNQISDLITCGVKISLKDMEIIDLAVDEAIQWLETYSGAAVRLINAKKKILENKVGPIIVTLESQCTQIKTSEAQRDEL